MTRRNVFGWDYPPGAANDPNAPYNQVDPPCEFCNLHPHDCTCKPCKDCELQGVELKDGYCSDCYKHHHNQGK